MEQKCLLLPTETENNKENIIDASLLCVCVCVRKKETNPNN